MGITNFQLCSAKQTILKSLHSKHASMFFFSHTSFLNFFFPKEKLGRVWVLAMQYNYLYINVVLNWMLYVTCLLYLLINNVIFISEIMKYVIVNFCLANSTSHELLQSHWLGRATNNKETVWEYRGALLWLIIKGQYFYNSKMVFLMLPSTSLYVYSTNKTCNFI